MPTYYFGGKNKRDLILDLIFISITNIRRLEINLDSKIHTGWKSDSVLATRV